MGESPAGWWIGGTVFVIGLVLFAVGLATQEDGVTNTLVIVGFFVAIGGAGIGCMIDKWLNDDDDSEPVSREPPPYLEPRPLPKRKIAVYVETGK